MSIDEAREARQVVEHKGKFYPIDNWQPAPRLLRQFAKHEHEAVTENVVKFTKRRKVGTETHTAATLVEIR